MKFRKQCRQRIRGLRLLRDYPAGSRVRIEGIRGCPKDRCRLLALGLTPGALAEVCANGGGSCCLRVRGADVVLDEALADTVSVQPLSEDEARTA
ncbi:FeoA family protein [Desulfocurvus sp. DL9XJH121]